MIAPHIATEVKTAEKKGVWGAAGLLPKGWGTSNESHAWGIKNPGSWGYYAPEPKATVKFRPLPGPFDEWGKPPKAGELRMSMPCRKHAYRKQPGDILTFWPFSQELWDRPDTKEFRDAMRNLCQARRDERPELGASSGRGSAKVPGAGRSRSIVTSTCQGCQPVARP